MPKAVSTPTKREGQDPPRRRSSARRLGLLALAIVPCSVLALWVAVNRVEWLGPIVADSLRSVIGKDAVTELENIAYSVQDRFYQYYRRGESPRAYWQVPSPAAAPTEPKAEVPSAPIEPAPATSVAPPPRPFRPEDVGPVHKSWSAPGDGQWVPILVSDLPELPSHMFKTLLHPDKNRSWAELFVVALDVARINVHLIPGTREPVATVEEAMKLDRPGRVPESDHARVIAAFNGGFKTEHGSYGMFVDGLTFVPPKPGVCAVAMFQDGRIDVDGWDRLAAQQAQMTWWRQTPNCMVQDGELHPKLRAGLSKKWGATLDGETVIRRSAIGVSADEAILYVGISNHTTAVAIAEGMRHAGARNVAQLDVNFSYPKFVLFETPDGSDKRHAVALAEGFEFSPDEYLRKRTLRDFFYVTPRELGSSAPTN